ncbi:hypothetical protein HK100_001965 [Physocladia obscura]|uniref:Uncharacterized protein n=1 Tax=Physocladia obscura TaxID=109957 RepID=A0AAD5SWC6_9FUNG|nr:hypothetical protein HK100_001965 [Physocladia obscura]
MQIIASGLILAGAVFAINRRRDALSIVANDFESLPLCFQACVQKEVGSSQVTTATIDEVCTAVTTDNSLLLAITTCGFSTCSSANLTAGISELPKLKTDCTAALAETVATTFIATTTAPAATTTL